MFRLWAKIWKNGKMKRDIVIENAQKDTRTHKVFQALEQVCYQFDLSVPMWLDTNIAEFQKVSKTKFHQDSFGETIDFDALEIQVIEEDMPWE